MKLSPTRQRYLLRQALKDDPTVVAGGEAVCRLTMVESKGVIHTSARFSAVAGRHGEHEVALVGLQDFPKLREVLSESFAASAVDKPRPNSRQILWQRGRVFLRFLRDQDVDMEPAALNGDLLARYVNWLNHDRNGGRSMAVATRCDNYAAALDLLRAGIDRGVIGDQRTMFDAPSNPWAGQQRTEASQASFADENKMATLLRACLDEVLSTMRDLSPLLDDLEAGRGSSSEMAEALRLQHAILAAGRSGYPVDPMELRSKCNDRVTRAFAKRLVIPGPMHLAPFFIALTHYTGWNPSTLFGLRLQNVRRLAAGEARWTTMTAFKTRAGRDQIATFADDGRLDGPDALLRFVERWTSTIRTAIGSDYLWVRAMNRSLREPDSTDILSPNKMLYTDAWQQRHGFNPTISLSKIRKGLIDLAHLRTGGDREVARNVGQQRSEEVFSRHYVSPSARSRDRSRLAAATTEMERWIASDGRVDVRMLPDTTDRSAATPGFRCFDNTAGEFSEPGRPCTAYGRCPACPLASVDVNSARSAGYLHLLLGRLNEGLLADDAMSAARFHGVWAPVKARLTFWLRLFSPEVRDAAKKLDLPLLPTLD